MKIVKGILEFDWDIGNLDKNKIKHDVGNREAEEVFFDKKRFIFKDKLHSQGEERFRILGKTRTGRLLFVVFTVRLEEIRIISARDVNRKEVGLYEKKIGSTKIQK